MTTGNMNRNFSEIWTFDFWANRHIPRKKHHRKEVEDYNLQESSLEQKGQGQQVYVTTLPS